MRAIDTSLVDEVWREIIAYPPAQAEDEARVFLERQPHVTAFCQRVTREFDVAVQKAALGLTFLLFKIFEASIGARFPPVAHQRIQTAYEATTEWLAPWERADPRSFLEGQGEFPRRNLIRHVLSVFYGGDANQTEYDQEVKASLFLLLKTVADALDMGEIERTQGHR